MEAFQGMKYVYEVYKAGSFSKAAENLFISQPSLSANVRREERAVGSPIFDRSGRTIALTECGLEYIRAAEQIMAAKNHFENCLNDLDALKIGTLSIGGTNLFASWILPPMLAQFSRCFPGIKVRLVEETSRELEHLLQNGTIDLVLDSTPFSEEVYEAQVYREETLFLAVPAEYEINGKLSEYQVGLSEMMKGEEAWKEIKPVPLHQFEGVPFILMNRDTDTGQRAWTICGENRFLPNVLFELEQQMTAYNITSSGMGVTFISDTLIRRVPFHERIVFYRLAGGNTRRTICFYWKRGRYRTKAMTEFLQRAAQPDSPGQGSRQCTKTMSNER